MKKISDIIKLPFLYYQLSGSEAVYSSAELGPLVFERLIQQKNDIFRNLAAGEAQSLPKTLILCDPLMYCWDQDKWYCVCACLNFLSESGYVIYVPEDRGFGFKVWDHGMMAPEYQSAAGIFWMSDDELISTNLVLRQMPRNQIGFLGSREIQLMLGTAYEKYPLEGNFYLDLGEMRGLTEIFLRKENEAYCGARLGRIFHEIREYMICDPSMTVYDNQLDHPAHYHFQGLKLTEEKEHFADLIRSGLMSQDVYAREITLDLSSGITEQDMKIIEELAKKQIKVSRLRLIDFDFTQEQEIDRLQLVLEKIKIRGIEIYRCSNLGFLGNCLLNSGQIFDSLHVCEYGREYVTVTGQRGLWSVCAELIEKKMIKKLFLSGCDLGKWEDFANAGSVLGSGYLEAFTISACSVDSARLTELYGLYGIHGGITFYDSGSVYSIGYDILSDDFELRDLKKLKLNLKPEYYSYSRLLKKAANLHALELEIDPIQYDFKLENDCRLESLKNLEIKVRGGVQGGGAYDTSLVSEVLAHADQLEYLVLNGVAGGQALDCDLTKMKNLRFLKLFLLKCAGYFCHFLKNCPALEEVLVSFDGLLRDGEQLEPFQNTTVKKLVLFPLGLNPSQISLIFNGLTNLSELELNDLDKKAVNGSDYQFETQALSRVSSFKYRNFAGLDVALFPNIFPLMKNLVECHLHDIFSCPGFDCLKTNPFPNLEFLTLSSRVQSHFPSDYLVSILSHAPKLRYLRLEGGFEPDFSLPSDLVLNSLEVLDISESDFLDRESLYAFLQKTPNLRELRIIERQELSPLLIPPGLTKLKAIVGDSTLKIEDLPRGVLQCMGKPERGSKKPVSSSASEIQKALIGIDVDDTSPQTFNCEQFFIERDAEEIPKPDSYRLHAYDALKLNPGVFPRGGKDAPFESFNESPLNLSPDFPEPPRWTKQDLRDQFESMPYDKEHQKLYLGKKKMLLDSNWRALPSLSPNEVITDIVVLGLDPDQFELHYSKRDSMYYIRSKIEKTRAVEVQFILKVKNRQINENTELRAIEEEYASVYGSLPDSFKSGTAEQWLVALTRFKAGACRHKAIAFFWQVNELYPDLQVRFVTNTAHTFVEIKNKEGVWESYDLGGYQAEVKVDSSLFSSPSESKNTRDLRREIKINSAFQERSDLGAEIKDPKLYVQDLFSKHAGQNLLLNFDSQEAIDEFQNFARVQAKHSSRPLYYIDSADDLNCYWSKINRNKDNRITVEDKKLGGPLYDFLTANHSLSPVLIINWLRFTHDEIVQVNSILDKHRSIQGVDLPEETTVIGLYQKNDPQAYRGGEFLSRIDLELKPGLSFPAEEVQLGDYNDELEDVYLYSSENWRSLLLGTYKARAQGWVFEEGPLIKALLGKKSIVLHDPPIHDRDFVNFIDQITIYRKFTIAGVEYSIDELNPGFHFRSGTPYRLEDNLNDNIQLRRLAEQSSIPKEFKILNPSTFNLFFDQYEISESHIYSKEGWLSAAEPGSTIDIYVSHTLTQAQWNRLNAQANLKTPCVNLRIVCPSDIELPDCLATLLESSDSEFNVSGAQRLTVIEKGSILPDTSSIMIDCSDLEIGDLFGKTIPPKKGSLEGFAQTTGLLYDLLSQKQKVTLTGQLTSQMIQMLIHWMQTHDFDPDLLSLVTSSPIPALAPFSKNLVVDQPEKLKRAQVLVEPATKDMLATRYNLITQALGQAPMVLVEGPTGGGKTTFILSEYERLSGNKVFNGLDSVEAWMQAQPSDQDLVLFFDEANITGDKKHQYTNFSGLFNRTKPYIVHQGKIVYLSPRHKIVFAGNPNTYGGERHQPLLFEHYPLARVHFNPLSDQHIADQVLHPKLNSDPNAQMIIQEFMKVYRLILSLSGNEPWITPRELEHMVHLYQLYRRRGDSSEDLASRVAVTVGHLCLPSKLHYHLSSESSSLSLPTVTSMPGHCVTASRREFESRLNEMLELRDLKAAGLLSGGLGGMIIEGDPATGKSEQVIAQLVAHGLNNNKTFYRIPLRMDFKDKLELLTRAYLEGAVVVIDEINASPAMEKFFNDALTGKLITDKEPKPGFLLIGTQNPATLSGRRELSLALQRRVLMMRVEPYPHEEMVEILVKVHQLPERLANEIVTDFELANKSRAEPHAFRVLMKKFREAIPDIIRTAKERSEGMNPQERMKFYTELLSTPSQTSGSATSQAWLSTYLKGEEGSQPTRDYPSPF